ncbi:metal ABC transporter substrate-binding protein [Succinivibrio sp.]|uniref:metal ABC transporter substrate-binding protein n=1 Tax=Succinivibrio sp. TaxID=2053619 RepID=UPI00386F5B23
MLSKLLRVFALLGSVMLSDCALAKELNIVTTNFPQYDFVNHIVKNKAKVIMLLKPGAQAHSFEPTPKDIISIQNSDLFVYNGGENDEWIEKLIKNSNNQIQHFSFVSSVNLREEETKEGMQSEEEDGDEHDHHHDSDEEVEYDEHVWTSPKNDIIILNKLCKKIISLDPDNAQFYMANAAEYIKEFVVLDKKFTKISDLSKNKLLIFADRFPLLYFVKDYNLDYYAAFKGCSSENEVSAATLKFLIDKTIQNNIKVIFKIELSSDQIANTVARQTNAKVYTFNTGHNVTVEQLKNDVSVASLFESNIDYLIEALN